MGARKPLTGWQKPLKTRVLCSSTRLISLAVGGNINTTEIIQVAYCLGQLQSELALPVLTSVLADGEKQEPIVRHEAAEALAAIGGEEALRWVKKYQ